MSCNASFVTKGHSNVAWGKVLPANLFRKALLIGTVDADVKVAFGAGALEGDAFTIKAGNNLTLDSVVPIDEVWAIGNLVVGEVS